MKMYKAFFYFCAMQNIPENLIIAIDGFSSSGKSTIAKDIAKTIQYKYLDTGSMYRALTYKILRDKINIQASDAIQKMLCNTKIDFRIIDGNNQILLDNEPVEDKIRGLDVANFVSEVSTIPMIRTFLVKLQQKIGEKGGIVMDGRDIGTVVFPNADVKFFISASLKTRAKRRFEELKAKKNTKEIDLEDVETNLAKRDKIDSERKHSPLKVAEDAIMVDTEKFTKKEQLDYVIKKIIEKTSSKIEG